MTTQKRNELKQAETAYDAAATKFDCARDLGDDTARKAAGFAKMTARANMEAALRAAGFSHCDGAWSNGTGEIYEIKSTLIVHTTADQTRRANRRAAFRATVDTRY